MEISVLLLTLKLCYSLQLLSGIPLKTSGKGAWGEIVGCRAILFLDNTLQVSAFLKALEPKEGTPAPFSHRQNSLPSFVLEATVLQITGVLSKNSGSQVPFQVFGIKLSDTCSRNLHLWQVLQIFFMYSKV